MPDGRAGAVTAPPAVRSHPGAAELLDDLVHERQAEALRTRIRPRPNQALGRAFRDSEQMTAERMPETRMAPPPAHQRALMESAGRGGPADTPGLEQHVLRPEHAGAPARRSQADTDVEQREQRPCGLAGAETGLRDPSSHLESLRHGERDGSASADICGELLRITGFRRL